MHFMMPKNARCAEAVGAHLHRETVHTHHGRHRVGVYELGHARERLIDNKVLARVVGIDDGLDQVLRHIPVVGQQLLWEQHPSLPKMELT